eukprot:TRINITY_DN5315_c0_g1_i1.p1 TRINITY_DN5315_c0_g1~~TRINITY_DN5315_c0_g1_i1.p1  ORF type:complete len:472 (+),score=105.82 TRINITY_DN5315_c0_g1_i1:163-1416(+)
MSTPVGEGSSANVADHAMGGALEATARDVEDQFRNAMLVKRYMEDPPLLVAQIVLPLPQTVRLRMIEEYYSFDEDVMRDLISSNSRNQTWSQWLQRGGDATRQYEGNARAQRQSTCLETIFETTEKECTEVISAFIRKRFALSETLAGKWARVVFLCHHKFEIPRKKVGRISFSQVDDCAGTLMTNWTKDTLELDLNLLEDLREIKTMFEHETELFEQYRAGVRGGVSLLPSRPSSASFTAGSVHSAISLSSLSLSSSPSTPRGSVSQPPSPTSTPAPASMHASPTATQVVTSSASTNSRTARFSGIASLWRESTFAIGGTKVERLNAHFIVLLRTLLSLGVGLSSRGECKDLFVDIEEKVGDIVCRKMQLVDAADINELFRELIRVFVLKFKENERITTSWTRFLVGVRECLQRLR